MEASGALDSVQRALDYAGTTVNASTAYLSVHRTVEAHLCTSLMRHSLMKGNDIDVNSNQHTLCSYYTNPSPRPCTEFSPNKTQKQMPVLLFPFITKEPET